MSGPQETFFNWSSGKDSAMALYALMQNPDYRVGHLLTSVNGAYDRVSMHGVRRELLAAQARAIGLPLSTVELPESPAMPQYETSMASAVSELRARGYTTAGFGDIFLQDLRDYRERRLKEAGMRAAFPLWGRDTRDLLEEFIAAGFAAIVVCVDTRCLDSSFAGRLVDADFLRDLPPGVDPCGENGEFHTFCFDGPVFSSPIAVRAGEKIVRTYPTPNGAGGQEAQFCFCDLLPGV